MTEVAFHFNAPDKWAYACRLLRKAVNAGARVAVVVPPESMESFDSLLWTFAPLEFVAHCRWPGSDSELKASPVLLTETLVGRVLDTHDQVLVNLCSEVPDGFEAFARVIEVVTLEEGDRQTARTRWKHYSDRGYGITRHDLKLKADA